MGSDKKHETCIVKSGMRKIYKEALEDRLEDLGIKVE